MQLNSCKHISIIKLKALIMQAFSNIAKRKCITKLFIHLSVEFSSHFLQFRQLQGLPIHPPGALHLDPRGGSKPTQT